MTLEEYTNSIHFKRHWQDVAVSTYTAEMNRDGVVPTSPRRTLEQAYREMGVKLNKPETGVLRAGMFSGATVKREESSLPKPERRPK